MFTDFQPKAIERGLPLPVIIFGETCPRSSTIHAHTNGQCVPLPVFDGRYPITQIFTPEEAAAREADRRARREIWALRQRN